MTFSSDTMKEENPDKVRPGVYYNRFAPAFYTGFAPRCEDPERIHIHLGRGNQLRVTVVLSKKMMRDYIPDLACRYELLSALVRAGRMQLTQNRGFEAFSEIIEKQHIVESVKRWAELSTRQAEADGLRMMKRLNPGRIFHIRINFEKRIKEWSGLLREGGSEALSPQRKLDIINDMLPHRIWATRLSPELAAAFEAVQRSCAREPEAGKDAGTGEDFYQSAVVLFRTATNNMYDLTGAMLHFYEFTAVYPVGTLNEFIPWKGKRIPLYPYSGVRRLRVHQRTRRIDHIPTVVNYSYFPWIPYMHVGKRLHNSFHTLWFHVDLSRPPSFLPRSWQENDRGSRSGEPFSNLWLLSRGPMSHGCTHVNAGHILELRQILPSTEEALAGVTTFRNRSHQFDVFDINGDGAPEVMGVKYFYAYTLKGKRPYRLRASPNRKAFYGWLYGSGTRWDDSDRLVFAGVEDARFVDNRAVKGRTFVDLPLYEAEYAPERLQFFEPAGIPFTRELRRAGATHSPDWNTLQLPPVQLPCGHH